MNPFASEGVLVLWLKGKNGVLVMEKEEGRRRNIK
jgi:hypothetical protein